MYIPKHFSEAEYKKIRNLIDENSFATILSSDENNKTYINHLPVIFHSDEINEDIIIGHMAMRNPQWSHFQNNPDCTMIFQGGHTYITPKWYRSGRDVPTWNYAIVHLYGKIELVKDYAEQIDILKRQTSHFEADQINPWEFSLPDDLIRESALTAAIISFKFKVEKIEAKFKLSQNRSNDDREGILAGLKNQTDEMSKLVMKMMLE